jgi:hypothetical protein
LTLIVSDNSPLNVLIRVGCEDILPKLFEHVLIPPEVTAEMAHPAAPSVIREFVQHLPAWLAIQSATQILEVVGGLSPLGCFRQVDHRVALLHERVVGVADDHARTRGDQRHGEVKRTQLNSIALKDRDIFEWGMGDAFRAGMTVKVGLRAL